MRRGRSLSFARALTPPLTLAAPALPRRRYNAAALAGWLYVLFLFGSHFAAGRPAAGVYAALARPLQAVQTAAALEVLHAAAGLVRSSPATAAVQVASRLVVLWGAGVASPAAAASPWAALMVAAWGASEPPRYAFYLYGLAGARPPAALTWVRYSAFLLLYPAGITGEIGCVWTAMRDAPAAAALSLRLPNAHNVVYDHAWVLAGLLLLYVPGSPYMIGHMVRQRKQVLGGGKGAAKEE